MSDYKINTPPHYRKGSDSEPSPDRVEWIDTLKVLTMILVVLGHCNYYTIKTTFGGVENSLANGEYSLVFKMLGFVTSVIYKFHMPLFMAVSGACFSWSIRKYETIGKLVRNKAKRLLVPFLLVTTFIAVPLKYCSAYYDNSSNVLLDILCGQFLLLGNSHLWFVVSLFYIFVVFFLLEKTRPRKNILYWTGLLGLSWLATGIYSLLGQSYGEMFGLYGTMKHLFFFSAGFATFKYWDDIKPLSGWKQVLSWIVLIGMIAFCSILPKYTDSFVVKAVLSFPVNTVLALWGCANMAFLAKSLDRCNPMKHSAIYGFMSRHNYELYLYSDPFNYVLIACLVAWFGQGVFTDNAVSLYAYAIRFLGSVLFAAFVIRILDFARKPIGKAFK